MTDDVGLVDEATVTIDVAAAGTDLTVTLDQPAGPFLPGDPIVVTATFVNKGPAAADPVTAQAVLAGAEASFDPVTWPGNTCTTPAACVLGPLAVGEELEVQYTINPKEAGDVILSVRATFPGTDLDTSNDTDRATLVVLPTDADASCRFSRCRRRRSS